MNINIIGSDAERRAGLKTLLRRIARQAQFNEAKDWRQARSLLLRTSPDMIMIDWTSDLRAYDLQSILDEVPRVPAAVMIDRCSAGLVYSLMNAGAMGIVPRALDPALILRALEMVLVGGHYIPADIVDPDLTREIAARRAQVVEKQLLKVRHHPTLSPRQQQIMRCVHMGSTNKMIAKTLGISEGTVKIHLASIFQQLGASNRAAAVAIYNGVLNPHLAILRDLDEQPLPVVTGEPGIIPLRRSRKRYPSLTDLDPASLPMAAEPRSPF
ncbi:MULTISPECIES: response regulator transcription factor [unclassified Caballeronia]|uniref:response regulator transcription factor n=1 Tax=unclassified Caballeronia TaxID=2646786 RepID=UPI00285C7AEC|nr:MULTISPECIES: response regulator transcription factor [unclassified Caballeronia]MDR5813754.1 response regulator transcription factor [Caballeronia sp. LZ033]MDR5820510.1 response regulator transcription factor [Caballeronia sp. LZ043]MDR5878326.1 response regulator transcription factor [Caballeronia sp. LZ032]